MKHSRLFALLLIAAPVLIVPASALAATTYYVDATNGRDTNSGTASTATPTGTRGPWKTIARVHTQPLQPGDAVLFRRGDVWRETLTVTASGAVNQPIVIGAYPRGLDAPAPIISGADVVSGWSLVNTGQPFYRAAAPVEPQVVFIGAVRATRQSEPTKLAANQWYWLSGNLYVRSNTPPAQTVEVPQRGAAIVIAGRSFITVQDLTLERASGSGLFVDTATVATSHITVSGITSRGSRHAGIAIKNGHPTLETTQVVIRNTRVHDNGASGINISEGVSDITIADNVSHHNNWAGGQYEAGIRIWAAERTARNLIVERNETYGTYSNGAGWEDGHGIWLDEVADDAVVRYNYSHDNANAGIFVEHSSRASVYYNLVVNNRGASILLYRGVHGNHIYNNTIVGGDTGIRLAGDTLPDSVTDNIVMNNISVGPTGQRLMAGEGGENDGIRGRGNVYLYNAFGPERAGFVVWGYGVIKDTYQQWESAYGGTTRSVQRDPRFVSATDFRLRADSPCRGAGINVGLTRDIRGVVVPVGAKPDIGAYQR